MRSGIRPLAAQICLSVLACAAVAAAEARQKYYAISGSTGFELYESIGRNGPRGSIAETRFDLKWQRLFDEEGGDCRLVRFLPELTITQILPKPSGKLPTALQRKWTAFIDGVRKHEDVHVVMIGETVKSTISATAGALVEDDPNCAKVKREVSRRIDEVMAAHKARNREFDRVELSEGGNVHRLILTLVND